MSIDGTIPSFSFLIGQLCLLFHALVLLHITTFTSFESQLSELSATHTHKHTRHTPPVVPISVGAEILYLYERGGGGRPAARTWRHRHTSSIVLGINVVADVAVAVVRRRSRFTSQLRLCPYKDPVHARMAQLHHATSTYAPPPPRPRVIIISINIILLPPLLPTPIIPITAHHRASTRLPSPHPRSGSKLLEPACSRIYTHTP